MFRIQRSADGELVVFTLSGRLKAARLAELQKLLECDGMITASFWILNEVKLVDRDTVTFLASCEAKGVNIANCPAYIREWIEKEAAHISVLKMSKDF